MKKDTRKILGISFLILFATGFLLFQHHSDTSEQPVMYQNAQESAQNDRSDNGTEETADSTDTECAVYIAGAVRNPGLYRYKGQARLNDAIEAVGGFTKNASKESVNLARFLSDGEQITVPTKQEVTKEKSRENRKTAEKGNSSNASALVNINEASSEELMTLPGVGQAKANLIIEYRTEHGSFEKKEDIMNISGIKEGVYNKVKDLITIS